MTETTRFSEPVCSEDWVHLNVYDMVAVQRTGECLQTGQIDAVTDDARIFWVHLDHGRGRILVHDGDDSVVRRVLIRPISYEILDWKGLRLGEEIEVIDNGLVISSGVIEDLSFDQGILRLKPPYGRDSRTFRLEDGWQVRAEAGTISPARDSR